MLLKKLGTFGLHTQQFKPNRWGYVGSIPFALADENQNTPRFETEQAAIDYAEKVLNEKFDLVELNK